MHFLTTSITTGRITSHASKKEKEMIARYLQGMANQPLRHNSFRRDLCLEKAHCSAVSFV